MSNIKTNQRKQRPNQNLNNASSKHNITKSQNNKVIKEENKPNYFLIPIILILCVIPFIVKLKVYNPNMSQFQWFSNQTSYPDFFLYNKQWLLVLIAGIMFLLVVCKALLKHKSISIIQNFIPLATYAILVLLSALFSKYSYFTYHGSLEQFESVFAILGYCIITYYAFLYTNSERDIQLIIKFLIIATFFMSIIGLLQYMGHDFFTSDIGYKLIVPTQYRSNTGITTSFGNSRVFMSLYNPNYVGVYVAMLVPIILVMALFQKKLVWMVLSIVSIMGLLICEYGSQSLAGLIGLGTVAILAVVFMWRYLLKRLYITIPIILILIFSVVLMNIKTDNLLVNKLYNSFQSTSTEYAVSKMNTMRDGISLTDKGNQMKVECVVDANQILNFKLTDSKNQTVATTYDAASNTYKISDQRFSDIVLGFDLSQAGVFYIQVDGVQYRFTNLTGDGKYYYINWFNKLGQLKTAPSAVFTGRETFASNRGYIWSRTIPLLKNYIILGSGPDTFTMVFPQNDYMNLNRYGYTGQIISKPHNMYLQIAIQTGLLSLIAFLTFYAMYFISSIRLYIRGRFNSYYAKAGVAIFIGTFAYMVTGLTNDSSITVAPIFWTLMGIGIAINHKVKPLMQEELIELKVQKQREEETVSKSHNKIK